MRLSPRARHALAVALAPAATLALFLLLTLAPLHAYLFGDPDFGYLFNSLLLAEGKGPWHVDHPGTPLQWLGAILLRLRYFLFGKEASLAADLIAHPLAYHAVVRAAGLLALLLAQVWSGERLLRAGLALPLVLLAQLSPFLVWDGVSYLARLSPETLLSAAGVCLVPFLIEAKRPIAIGLVLALMATLKASALPLLLVIFLLPSWRQRGKAVAVFLAAYALITIPIWPRLAWMLAWYGRVLTSGGLYGQEGSAFTLPHFLGPLGFLRHTAPLALAIFALLGWWLYAKKKHAFGARKEWPLAAAALLLLFLVLKHPAPRYLLALCPLVPVAAARLRRPPLEKLLPLALLLPALFLFPPLLLREREVQARMQANITQLENILAKSYAACHVALLDDVALPAFALYAGNLATDNEHYAGLLRERFPLLSFRQSNLPTWRAFGGVISDEDWARAAREEICLVVAARRDGGPEHFEKIFGEPPRELASVGPYGFYKIFGLGSGAEARVWEWAR